MDAGNGSLPAVPSESVIVGDSRLRRRAAAQRSGMNGSHVRSCIVVWVAPRPANPLSVILARLRSCLRLLVIPLVSVILGCHHVISTCLSPSFSVANTSFPRRWEPCALRPMCIHGSTCATTKEAEMDGGGGES